MPAACRARYQSDWGLSPYDAATLTQSRDLSAYFEAVVHSLGATDQAKLVANWVTGELAAALNRDSLEVANARIGALALSGLLRRIVDGTISGKIAKDVFDAMWTDGAVTPGAADDIIEARGLRQISDSSELESIIDAIIQANPAQVAEVRAGKEKAFNYFVGQAMKATRGKGNPATIYAILRARLTA